MGRVQIRRTVSGITLIEMLVVLLIIALLSSALYPLILSVRKKSYETMCLSNMRQLGTAWLIYSEDYGDYPPSIVELRIYVKSTEVYRCPADRFQGLQKRYTEILGLPVSYLDLVPDEPDLPIRSTLRRIDANHGIIACALHGEPLFGVFLPDLDPVTSSTGKVFRVLNSGSVKIINVEPYCYRAPGGGRVRERSLWRILSDLPCPAPFCITEYERVPCP